MRYESKAALIESIEVEHRKFVELAATVPERRYRETGVWGDDWTLRDLLSHLTAWEQMFLRWYREGESGQRPALPAPGYAWRETPALNRAIRQAHARKSVARVRTEFAASYAEILALARELSEAALLTPGRFGWTGKNALVTYLGANTASHYRAATKILKRWLCASRI